MIKPQPPSYEGVRALYGDYHLADLKTDGNWRTMGSVWAVRNLLGTDCREGRTGEWRCPYGANGDRLWVREAFTYVTGNGIRVHYRADGEPTDREGRVLPTEPGLRRWSPSIHMPRKHSRITLEVASVRVERLRDISEADAKAEGVDSIENSDERYRFGFCNAWHDINGAESWVANPWVWVVEFTVDAENKKGE